MAHKHLVVALGLMVAASPAAATQELPPSAAPPGTPTTKYCLHVAPLTGSLVETVQCWTREEWAEQDVDVDKEWAKEGVGVIG
jgi:hypothetical protein